MNDIDHKSNTTFKVKARLLLRLIAQLQQSDSNEEKARLNQAIALTSSVPVETLSLSLQLLRLISRLG